MAMDLYSPLSLFRNLWTRWDNSKPQQFQRVGLRRPPASIDCDTLVASSQLAQQPRIDYAYDPLAALPIQSRQKLSRLANGDTSPNGHFMSNSMPLDPLSAGLPYRSSLDHVRASKFWEANLSETITLFELLAVDKSASDIEVDHGITVAKLAGKALRTDLEHQMVLATHYMFPGASEQRIRQIAALVLTYFIFDDKAEETPNKALHVFRNDFLRCFDKEAQVDLNKSPMLIHMNEILSCIESEDNAGGNGGREMLDAIHDAFRCVHPPDKGFQNVDEYLHFRRQNVGAAFVIAAAKFSIKSNVSTADPRFTRYLSLVGDHLGLVNDLASYDKELHALENGETEDMINLVAVVKSVASLHDTNDAKSVVWNLQLQTEADLVQELKYLRAQGLNDEEWWFLEAVAFAATGNVMFCMTTSRYGGEAARIASKE